MEKRLNLTKVCMEFERIMKIGSLRALKWAPPFDACRLASNPYGPMTLSQWSKARAYKDFDASLKT